MALGSPTPLLDLAETVSRTALVLTKSLLQEKHAAAPVEPSTGSNGVKEINGVNGLSNGPQGPSPPNMELMMAKQALNQAASELLMHVMGPDNYLKSFSYGVGYPIHSSVRCGLLTRTAR